MKLLQLFALLLSLTFAGFAQQKPAIQVAHAGEITVTGVATPGSGPLVIMNVQFPAAAKIGTGDVARDGTFAIALKEPLVEGHGLIVIDNAARKSDRFNVSQARTNTGLPEKK